MTGQVLPFESSVHKRVDALLPWFVNQTLEGDELALVQRHLDECARCRQEVEWLRALFAACLVTHPAPTQRSRRSLRRQRAASSVARRLAAAILNRWGPVPHWAKWAIAMQLAVIIGGGALWIGADEAPLPQYRTLGTVDPPAHSRATMVVVFDANARESWIRDLVRAVGAQIVEGPTQSGAYVLALPAERQSAALEALRKADGVVLAERLSPGADR